MNGFKVLSHLRFKQTSCVFFNHPIGIRRYMMIRRHFQEENLDQKRRKMGNALSLEKESEAEKPKVVVIAGPTACGKSDLALRLCQSLDGELISADSVQIYKDLQIGANKPSAEDLALVPHHLVSEVDLSVNFTAGDFCRRAMEAIDDVISRGKLPVVCGGTMMYVQWLVHGSPDAPKANPEVQARAAALLAPFKELNDWEGALEVLRSRNPARAEKIQSNDWYRLDRALQIMLDAEATISSVSEGANSNGKAESKEVSEKGERTNEEAAVASPPSVATPVSGGTVPTFTGERSLHEGYDFRCFFLVGDRATLAHRIDGRCAKMLSLGLLEEVQRLLTSQRLERDSTPAKAIGYRQTIDYFLREDFQEHDTDAFMGYFNDFAKATRNYATAQMKWYRKDSQFVWVKNSFEEESSIHMERDIKQCISLNKSDFDEMRNAKTQEDLRKENIEQGKKMKTYTVDKYFTNDDVNRFIAEADVFSQKIRDCVAIEKK